MKIYKFLANFVPHKQIRHKLRERQRDVDLKEKKYPSIFQIETVLGCDLKCLECAYGSNDIERPNRLMKFDEFEIIANKIKPYSEYIYLHCWGEPMLNPDIYKMIQFAGEFAKTNISTNCKSLNKEKIEKLIMSGVSDLLVSIDGVTQKIYESYRVGGDISHVYRCLEEMVYYNNKYGGKVNIIPQFCVFKHNEHEMTEFTKKCESLGLKPCFRSAYLRNKSSLQLPKNELYHRKSYSNIHSLTSEMKNCCNFYNTFLIFADGQVPLCCYDYNGEYNFGNLITDSFLDIWDSSNYSKLRQNAINGNIPKFCVNNCLQYTIKNK